MPNNLKVEPIAYISILKHLKKVELETKESVGGSTEKSEKERKKLIYGFLLGFIEEESCIITDYVPIMHVDSEIDFETLHGIFHSADRVNEENYDPDFISEQVIGWVRSSATDSVQYSNIDIKNHIYIQTAYNENAVLLLLPCSGDQFTMEFRGFRDKIFEIDESSPFSEIEWNFKEVDDIDKIFQTVVDIYRNRSNKKPLIKELAEIYQEQEEGGE